MITEVGKALIFLESNTTGTGRLFVRAARAAGFQAVLLTEDPKRYPFVQEDTVPVIRLNTQDEQAIVEACNKIAEQRGIAGIASTSDHYLTLAARLAERFGLPGPSAEAIAVCRNKSLQYRTLSDAGSSIPGTIAAQTVNDAVLAATRLGLPVVIKPEQGTGSVGVKLCEVLSKVEEHAQFLLSQNTNERGFPIRPAIIIQEYVEGQEYSVEAISGKVIGITRKHLGSRPHFVETGHDYPAILPDNIAAAIVGATMQALGALNLHWGAVHVELRWAPDGPKIIEVNPRLAGGFIPELIRAASGFDIIPEVIRCVVGHEPEIQSASGRFAAIRFIIPDRSGKLKAVTGLDEADHSESVMATQVYRPTGSDILLCGDFRDRIGHIIISGDEPNLVTQRIESALSSVKIEMG